MESDLILMIIISFEIKFRHFYFPRDTKYPKVTFFKWFLHGLECIGHLLGGFIELKTRHRVTPKYV